MDHIGIEKQCGYVQVALEKAVVLSPSYLSHIERAVKKASPESLVQITEVLGGSLDWLLNGADISVESTFLPETQDLLGDCSPKERRILDKVRAC